MSTRKQLCAIVVCGWLVWPNAAPAAGPTIRVIDVPDPLILPIAAGRNVYLTVRVEGEPLERVWIARTDQAGEGIALTSIGGGEYQINLADRDLYAYLARRDAGAVRVFAEADGDAVVEGPTVHYRIDLSRIPTPRLYVWQGQERPQSWHSLHDDAARLDAKWATRLELVPDGGSPAPTARLVAPDHEWTFARDEASGTLQLEVSDEVRAGLRGPGPLRVLFSHDGRQEVTLGELRTIPARLNIGSEARLTLHQRAHGAIPGSAGYLRIETGDITGGYVSVTIRRSDGVRIAEAGFMREGDRLSFSLGSERYVLALERLVNLLVGEDYAEFVVCAEGNWSLREIDRLLLMLERSDATFVREGRDYSGREAADHLRAKLDSVRSRVVTVDDFIEQVAESSWESGRPYLVRFADGAEMTLGAWLRRESNAAGRPPEAADQQREQDEDED